MKEDDIIMIVASLGFQIYGFQMTDKCEFSLNLHSNGAQTHDEDAISEDLWVLRNP